jgi:S1-C subfamily serine protease
MNRAAPNGVLVAYQRATEVFMRPFDLIGDPRPHATVLPVGQPVPLQSPQRAPHRAAWTRTFAAGVLTVGAVAAGAAGGIAVTRLAPPVQATPQPAPTAAAAGPSAVPVGAAQTIASSVYQQTHAAVVQLVIDGGSPRSTGTGSGVVIDSRGYILTNYHVIQNARTITVKFDSGATRQAQVTKTDAANDLALIKVDLPAGVPVAKLGDSDAVKVGELAIAIGSPFGLDQTVTQGIVSATNRTYQPNGGPSRRGLIQTDAPINPGNSGGPLINAAGEVIGINSFIESPVEGSVGIGFAVPINVAKQLLPAGAPSAAAGTGSQTS